MIFTSRRLVRARASLWQIDESSHASIRFLTWWARVPKSLPLSSMWVDNAKHVRVENNHSAWVASSMGNEEEILAESKAIWLGLSGATWIVMGCNSTKEEPSCWICSWVILEKRLSISVLLTRTCIKHWHVCIRDCCLKRSDRDNTCWVTDNSAPKTIDGGVMPQPWTKDITDKERRTGLWHLVEEIKVHDAHQEWCLHETNKQQASYSSHTAALPVYENHVLPNNMNKYKANKFTYGCRLGSWSIFLFRIWKTYKSWYKIGVLVLRDKKMLSHLWPYYLT